MPGFRAEEVSLALAGFKLTATDLRALADANGLRKLRHVAADLNTAAWWRNEHQKHPRILAFARGRHPGVHTLRHFAPARSRELARALLLSAAQDAGFTGGRSRHRELLERLANTPDLEPLRSLETVADFLAAWSQHTVSATDDAPLRALPVLGLLADDQIFATSKNVELRLVRNLEVIQTILDARRHQLARLRDQFGKWKNRTQRNNLLDLLNRAEALQRQPTTENRAALSLTDAETIFHPPKEAPPEPTPHEPESETPPEDDDDDEHSGELNERKLSRATSEALLDNRQEELEAAAEAMEEALHQAITRDGKQAEGSVEFRGETREFCVKLDPKLGAWLHKFCADDAWGGVIESSETALDLALAHCESGAIEPKILSADAVAKPEEREPLSMSELLRAWDEDLTEEAPGLALAQKWERFVALRSEVVQHLDALVYLPSTWLAGKPALAGTLTEYLKFSGEFYGALQRYYRAMADHSQSWARAAIEAALALDVLQVRIALPDGKEAYKAILLPTHPLHLWRRQRLTSVLRGLGENLDARDREAILRESERPEHFLSVISVGSIPAGRGVNQILPVANDLHGMATFENLLNAYGGPDGADTLAYAINRFAVLGRQHARPMRVVIVNPPDAPRLLAKIVSVFKQRRRETLPCLSLELYATTDHAARIQAAMRFDGGVRELLEDPIAAGRLRFRAHEKPRKLAELLVELRTHPCHILAIFDEATIRIRRRGTGRHLPMSPFCVRHEITFDRRENVLRLSPTTDEPPFSEFMQLINEAESGQRDSSPHAWADAESLRQVVDDVLQGNSACARWLFLADRALPAESGLKSVRLLQKRDGHRQVLLATANHERMARLVRGVFDRSGLSLSSDELQRLLEEGVNLSGAGLLDLIKEDGLPDRSKVVGLAGALVASRDYRRRHPECLLVSVDNEVARLWLRLGRSGDRCDLIGARREGDTFVVEAIEVKATEDVEAKALTEPVRRAQEQITAVLTAVAAALPDDPTGNSPLSAPRCEMLKEVLVRGCQSRALPPEKRAMWSGWLKELFRQEGNVKPVVKFSGEVICVLPRAAAAPADKALANNQFAITARYLYAKHIEELLRDATRPPEGPDSPPSPSPPRKPSPAPEGMTKSSSAAPPPAKIEAARPATPPPPRQQPATKTAAPRKDASSVIWPPHLNALGMIGQAEAVEQIISQVNYAKAASRRFSDKLLVGSAGVGKTSLARAIARQLLGEDEILFNGSDLRQPTAVITRLKERKKLPSRAHGTVKVQPCLIFIDEVHAISNNVETTLLSALESDRTTSIESVLYDFSDVVFILATTDSGRLGGAFNSRPDKLYLRNYTLDEMAGIIWLRGKEELGGEELSRAVCFEIAARMRCRPRESVNCLRQRLVPYFHSRTHQAGAAVDFSRIAAAMTPQSVAEYFDTQGIDLNGLNVLTRNYLQHIAKSGAQSEERLRSALGISNRGDFIEVDEYLTVRLRLVTISSAGRSLTADGRKYINAPFDLRERISRQT